MADDVHECGHDACGCAASDGDYCSPYCESAYESGVTSLTCDCGHPGCATNT